MTLVDVLCGLLLLILIIVAFIMILTYFINSQENKFSQEVNAKHELREKTIEHLRSRINEHLPTGQMLIVDGIIMRIKEITFPRRLRGLPFEYNYSQFVVTLYWFDKNNSPCFIKYYEKDIDFLIEAKKKWQDTHSIDPQHARKIREYPYIDTQ